MREMPRSWSHDKFAAFPPSPPTPSIRARIERSPRQTNSGPAFRIQSAHVPNAGTALDQARPLRRIGLRSFLLNELVTVLRGQGQAVNRLEPLHVGERFG